MSMKKKRLVAANGYQYTVQVNDEDAERYGLKPSAAKAENKKGQEPENKKGDEAPRRPGAARRRES